VRLAILPTFLATLAFLLAVFDAVFAAFTVAFAALRADFTLVGFILEAIFDTADEEDFCNLALGFVM
jgi:hypothetical protein